MCIKRLEDLNVTKGDIIVEGSYAKNEVLCSLIAALKPNQNVYAAVDQAGTARGAALLANWPPKHDVTKTVKINPAKVDDLKVYFETWKAKII